MQVWPTSPCPLVPPTHAASWSIVLISVDAKQTQRRNYKQQRQRPINSWITGSSCADSPGPCSHWGLDGSWAGHSTICSLPPLLTPQASMSWAVRELGGSILGELTATCVGGMGAKDRSLCVQGTAPALQPGTAPFLSSNPVVLHSWTGNLLGYPSFSKLLVCSFPFFKKNFIKAIDTQ